MSTFYSDLAKNASESTCDGFKGSFIDFPADDLDDILDNLNAPQKPTKNVTTAKEEEIPKNQVQPEAVERSPMFTDKVQIKRTEHIRSKNRKNVLDLLTDPYEEALTVPQDEEGRKNEKTTTVMSEPNKRVENSRATKRSVRFSDSINFDAYLEEGEESSGKRSDENLTKGDGIGLEVSTQDVKPAKDSSFRQRPHTAPGLTKSVKSSLENLLADDSFPDQTYAKEIAEITVPPRSRMRRPSSMDSLGKGSDPFSAITRKGDETTVLSSFSRPSFAESVSPLMNVEWEAKLKRMEVERDSFKAMLDLIKRQHAEEIAMIDRAAKSKLDLMDDGAKRRENRLKEELTYLEDQNRERLVSLEKQRDQLAMELSTKLTEARTQAAQELERVKEFYDQEIKALKSTHEEMIERIRKSCQQEAQTLGELQPNTESLKRLLEQLNSAAVELCRTETDRQREASVRQEQLMRREEMLRLAEERLNQREEELDRERKQTADILAKLEYRLRENTKIVSEDRWAIKQEHNRLEKLQIGMEEERKGLVEQAGRERAELQQLVNNFLAEHRKSLGKNSEERAQIAAEQQRLRADQLAWEEHRSQEQAQLQKAKDEVSVMKDALAAERRRLDERANKIRVDEVKLEETRRQLDIVRCDLAREQESLNSRNQSLIQQTAELAHRIATLAESEKGLAETEARQQAVQREQSRQFEELQTRTEKVHEAEQNLMLERKELARQHQEVAQLRREASMASKLSTLCANCRVPVREKVGTKVDQLRRTEAVLKNRRQLKSTNDLRVAMLGDTSQFTHHFRNANNEEPNFSDREKQFSLKSGTD
ncbi:unnamed protein product [Calicophoron daubneyi]|uniref:Fas-binding factor 1 C-terminal domain-containing protein n=1 Tax=Calicophoron daubneyi TaxID=300641 RepID=A0AAV2T651_CALDB